MNRINLSPLFQNRYILYLLRSISLVYFSTMASNKPLAANDVAAASPDLTILDHPIPKMSDTAGKLHVYGDPSSKHLIIMSAGFPDSQQAMTPMARRLATSGDCLVGITCPPGYDDTLDVESN
jgi:hypothetical protein